MDIRNAPEEPGPKPVRYSFLAELLETTRRNEVGIAKVLEKQEEATSTMLKLHDHKTIEKTDELWSTMSNVMFAGKVAVRIFAWFVGITASLGLILLATRQLFGWPQ